MLRSLLVLPFLFVSNIASAAIISDYNKSAATTDGWSIVYQGGYGGNFDYNSVLLSIAAGSRVALASSASDGNANFDLFASTTLDVLNTITAINQTISADDAYWYRNGSSVGFSKGSTIFQTSADAEGIFNADDGTADFDISWHAGQGGDLVRGGWRSGLSSGLNNNNTWQRYVLVQNPVAAAVPEPSILALMGLGVFGLTLARRKMKK